MRINVAEVVFNRLPSGSVIATYKGYQVMVNKYNSYQLNRKEAIIQIYQHFTLNMKILNKDNFMAAVAAFVEGQDEDKDEHYASDAGLAESYLTAFYDEYFEIDHAKDARRAEYLKLKEEFGDE